MPFQSESPLSFWSKQREGLVTDGPKLVGTFCDAQFWKILTI